MKWTRRCYNNKIIQCKIEEIKNQSKAPLDNYIRKLHFERRRQRRTLKFLCRSQLMCLR